MPTPLAPGNIIKVQGICTRDVQTSLNTAYFEVTTIAGLALTDQQVANNFDALLGPAYKAFIHTQANYFGTLVQKILPLPVLVHVIGDAAAGAGTNGTSPELNEMCALLSVKTAIAGRAFRGRMFLPFIDRANTGANQTQITAAQQTLAEDIGAIYFNSIMFSSGLNSVNLEPVLLHRKANISGTTTPNSVTPIASFTAELLLATQRRRSARGRANPPPS